MLVRTPATSHHPRCDPEGAPAATKPTTASAIPPRTRRLVQPAVAIVTLERKLSMIAVRVRNDVIGSMATSRTGSTVPNGPMLGGCAHAGASNALTPADIAAPNRPAAT